MRPAVLRSVSHNATVLLTVTSNPTPERCAREPREVKIFLPHLQTWRILCASRSTQALRRAKRPRMPCQPPRPDLFAVNTLPTPGFFIKRLCLPCRRSAGFSTVHGDSRSSRYMLRSFGQASGTLLQRPSELPRPFADSLHFPVMRC